MVKVLVEIHNEPDLKLNLKFEIEVLCKDLNIDLRSIVVGNCLKESSRLVCILLNSIKHIIIIMLDPQLRILGIPVLEIFYPEK